MISELLARSAVNDHIKALMDGNVATDWASLLGRYQGMIISGKYPDAYLDLITQRYNGFDDLSLAEAYSFAQTHYMIRTAKVAAFCISAGVVPSEDRYIAANDAVLRSLPNAAGRFDGGTQLADGFISWSTPRWGVVLYPDSALAQSVPFLVMIPPGTAPLEVGTISAAKVYLYLNRVEKLARWPYESTLITVLTTNYVHGDDAIFDHLVSQCQETAADFVVSIGNPINHWRRN